MPLNNHLKIGELAENAGCQVETIRFYERKGLLPAPLRSEGNYRLYGEVHVERLQFIRHCRSLDMSLEEIAMLLDYRDAPDQNCAGVNAVLDKHIGHVTNRIKELKNLQALLKQLRSQCQSTLSTRECGILQGLSESGDAPPTNLGSHAGGCH
ncbi:MAG: Cd(II)/Pb(II)-responsive transcriptional regulator [Pseudomonadota bacterium]